MFRNRIVRITSVVLVILIVSMSGVAGYVGYSVYFRPLPETSGVETVTDLQDMVSIYRDSWSIPQIYASNTYDLFFSQGYVQSQERWWQMELSRYIGMGRLREIITGHAAILNADRWMLMLGLADAARRDWERASLEVQTALEAYSAGVNAYIQGRSMQDLASTYGLLGLSGQFDNLLAYLGRDVTVEPWEPYHSLLLMRMFAWRLEGGMLWSELENIQIAQRLSPELINSYFVDYPYAIRPTTLSLDELGLEAGQTFSPAPVALENVLSVIQVEGLVGGADLDLMALLGFRPYLGGNAWVVSGDRTESGSPLLANDVQMPIEIPSVWYEIGLHCTYIETICPYDVSGFSLPGVPGVMVGHNDQIAWGINPLQADVQDIYLLHLNPENPTQYEVDGQWWDMEQQTVILQMSDDEQSEELPLEFTYYRTRYGPVITDMETLLSAGRPIDQALSLRWVAEVAEGDPIGAILQLNRAQNWDDFRAALSEWFSPALGIIYADVSGNIGYQTVGAIPIRSRGHSGLTPASGWNLDHDWRGFIPFDLLPQVYNPTDGMIVSSDNAIVPEEYYAWLMERLKEQYPELYVDSLNVFFSHEWAMGYRAARIEVLDEGVTKHSSDSFAQIQGDHQNLFAQELLPYVFMLTFETAEFQQAIDWLKEWDLQNDKESPQAVLFEVLAVEILRLTFSDELGFEPAAFERERWVITQLAAQPNHLWWDDVSTPLTIETRDDVLRQALINALDWLINELGTEQTEWTWGKLHTGRFVSRVIGYAGFLENNPAVNSGPFPINQGDFELSGGIGTVNATSYITRREGYETSFEALTIPSYRLIVDLSSFSQSRAMHATGQSGHPASDNYKDMIAPWRSVEYHDMRWGVDEVRQQATKRLDLRPE